MLGTVDARELAEWEIVVNLDYWRKRVAESMETQASRSAQIKTLLKGAESSGNPDI
jgi:hypothetical protein